MCGFGIAVQEAKMKTKEEEEMRWRWRYSGGSGCNVILFRKIRVSNIIYKHACVYVWERVSAVCCLAFDKNLKKIWYVRIGTRSRSMLGERERENGRLTTENSIIPDDHHTVCSKQYYFNGSYTRSTPMYLSDVPSADRTKTEQVFACKTLCACTPRNKTVQCWSYTLRDSSRQSHSGHPGSTLPMSQHSFCGISFLMLFCYLEKNEREMIAYPVWRRWVLNSDAMTHTSKDVFSLSNDEGVRMCSCIYEWKLLDHIKWYSTRFIYFIFNGGIKGCEVSLAIALNWQRKKNGAEGAAAAME